MKLIKFGLIILGVLLFGWANAQSVTEIRQIKTTALQVYEHYKVVMSGLYSKSAYTEDNFMALFDLDALIYNDILPDNNPSQLSPSRYYKKFKASVKRIYPVFSDFKMGEPVSVGNKWQIKCNFTRGTRFLTQKDIKYPEWFFNYIMTIEMNKSYNVISKVYENAGIVNVNVDNPLKGFFIIENKGNIPLVAKSGEELNDWDEEYQSRIFSTEKWKIQDMRVPESIGKGDFFEFFKGNLSKSQTDANFYKLDSLQLKKNIYGVGITVSPNKMETVNVENLKDIQQTSNALSLSLFYGKQIAHKGKSTWFFNVGLDFNYVHREYNNIRDDSIIINNNSINIGNDTIINIISGSVPLSLQYLHQLTAQAKKPVFLSFELGVFPELKTNTQHSILCLGGGLVGNMGLWFALNNENLLKFNVSYKYSSSSFTVLNKVDRFLDTGTKQGMQNIGIGISWVKTIGGK